MIDLHLHILPGLDDGAADMETALAMCKRAVRDGTTLVTATPHMFNGVFDVTRDQILEGVAELQDRVLEEGLDLQVKPGAELHIHEDLPRFFQEGEAMTLGDQGPYILLELPPDMVPAGLDRYLFNLQLAGMNPIIAHPERNPDVQADPECMTKAVSAGVMLQVTADSLIGDFGRKAHRCAEKLLNMGMAHLVASDAHSVNGRPPSLAEAFDRVRRILGPDEADEVFFHRPARILAGESVDVPEVRKRNKVGFFKRLGF